MTWISRSAAEHILFSLHIDPSHRLVAGIPDTLPTRSRTSTYAMIARSAVTYAALRFARRLRPVEATGMGGMAGHHLRMRIPPVRNLQSNSPSQRNFIGRSWGSTSWSSSTSHGCAGTRSRPRGCDLHRGVQPASLVLRRAPASSSTSKISLSAEIRQIADFHCLHFATELWQGNVRVKENAR